MAAGVRNERECLRTTSEDCYTLKVAATSMRHPEQVVNELTPLGTTTTNIVYTQTLPLRGIGLSRPGGRECS
jgi:Lrp/AsnC family transcriptional regulator, leucine-responsive regulatory protein